MTLQDYNLAREKASDLFDYFMYNRGSYQEIMKEMGDVVDYPEMSELFINYGKDQRGEAVDEAAEHIHEAMTE